MIPLQHNDNYINERHSSTSYRKNGGGSASGSNALFMNPDTTVTLTGNKLTYNSRPMKSRDSDDELASPRTKIAMEEDFSFGSLHVSIT